MRINHNVMASNANRYLSATGFKQSKSLEKISSGLRINTAADDAAGLAISEKMRAQVSGLEQAADNALDGISLLQTAEGALQETHSILQRMRELAVQSANDTNTQAERDEIQKEVDELAKEITRIANNTEFNSKKISNGGLTEGNIGQVKFHIGANTGQDISLSLSAMDAKSLGVSRDVTVASGTIAGGSDITSVTFNDASVAGVEDGVDITFDYNAAVTEQYGSSTAANAAGLVDMAGLVGSEIAVTVGTETFTLAHADIVGLGNVTDRNAYVNVLMNSAMNGANALSTVATVTLDASNHLVITANDAATGTDVSVAVTAGTAGGGTGDASDFGFAGGDTEVTGRTAAAAYVEITNTAGTPVTQNVEVTGTDSTLTVTSGDYSGLSIDMGSATLADLDSVGDVVTVVESLDAATAATFAAGELDQEAYTAAGVDMSTQTSASAAIETIENAISSVSAERSKLGAYQNRLEHTINNLNTTSENLQASESRIRDVDIAKEMMNFTKLGILQQAAQSMLAQANQAPQGVLQLLR